MTRVIDGPSLVAARRADKPFIERLAEHREAIRHERRLPFAPCGG